MANSRSLRERIEEETGMNFGMHKDTAFLTFQVRKTESHKVSYDPALRPDWALYHERHPQPAAPSNSSRSVEKSVFPDQVPAAEERKRKIRRSRRYVRQTV